MEILERANKLKEEIKELESFLYTVTKFDDKCNAIPSVKVFMKNKVTVETSFLGSRFFGSGSHEQNIIIPDSIRNELLKFVKRRERQLEKELESLFNN